MLGSKPLSIFHLPNVPLKGFESESLSHMLDMLATLPVSTTCVVTSRVAGMSNKCDKNTGSQFNVPPLLYLPIVAIRRNLLSSIDLAFFQWAGQCRNSNPCPYSVRLTCHLRDLNQSLYHICYACRPLCHSVHV